MKSFYKELAIQGKSIKWLADKLGVSHQAVYMWKLGKSKPKIFNLKKISQLLKIDIKILINEHFMV